MTALTAVIVNHSKSRLLNGCLTTLAASLEALDAPSETIVVDNGSTDDSCELVSTRFPQVELLAFRENRGFGAAANAGIARARGEWILLLNNDLTVERDAAREMLAVARVGDPDLGSVAAQMRFADGSERINSAGIEVDRLGVARDRLLGRPASAAQASVEVFGASAGAALYRRRMLDELGGFDESFFVFLEDVDLAWRARMAGWHAMYAPGAVVHHLHSATSVHGSAFKHRHVGRNRMRLLAKNADRTQLRRYGPAILGYELAYVAYAVLADRSIAPIRGRVEGLREWRGVRARSATLRRPVRLSAPGGLSAALRRRSAWRQKWTPAR